MKETLEEMGFTISMPNVYGGECFNGATVFVPPIISHPLIDHSFVPNQRCQLIDIHRWLIHETKPETPGRAEAILRSREALIRSLEAA